MAAADTTVAIERSERSGRWRALLPYGAGLAIVAVAAYFAVASPLFLTKGNLQNIVVQSTVVAVAAYGLTVVLIVGGGSIINGGIDISVGAVLGLASAVAALLIDGGHSEVVAAAAALGVCAVVGIVNGLGAVSGLPALIVTLGTLNIVTGFELLLSDSKTVGIASPASKWLADGTLLGVPPLAVVLLAISAGFYVAIHHTRVGMRAYAVGGNRAAAHLAGIGVKRYVFGAYAVAAVTAGVAGLLLLARIHASQPGAGGVLLLDIALASFISSIFSRRLLPNIGGTLVGALFAGLLTNGFTLTNVPTYWVSTVKGALVLGVVAAAALVSRRRTTP
jgi:ribose transport system permease protein